MKKFLSLILAAAMLLACAMTAAAEEPADENALQIGVYNIVNQTGDTVTYLNISDNLTGESTGMTFPAEEGIENGDSVVLSFAIPANEDGSHRLTFSFKTAGGYEASFATLSIEEVTLTLLAADAMTGATPFTFAAPTAFQTGTYVLRNVTGSPVTEVTLSDNVTGAAVSFMPDNGLQDGETMSVSFSIPAEEDGNHRLTLHFTIDNGDNNFTGISFDTLSIEEVTLELLSVDAASGATPVRFVVGK